MKQQQGGALIFLLTILVMGFATLLVQAMSHNQLAAERQQQTQRALVQAKQALMGYAISYGETHSGEAYGFLPCPDLNGSNGQGNSSLNCSSRNVSMLGRLPWKSFELDAIRDGYAECLWYVVSGSFKSNPKTELMNWDTPSQLRVYHPDGNLLADDVAAVIIAPNPVLSNQNRSGNTSICGGNYTAANYLDHNALYNNANINNASNAISDLINGPVYVNQPMPLVNDQILIIRRAEIFDLIKKRNDFAQFITQLLNQTTSCLSSLAAPVTLNFNSSPISENTSTTSSGALTTGRPRKSCLPAPLHNWQDNLLYGKCTDNSTCLTINGANCRGIIIFSGERNHTQLRQNHTQKNDWNNYLEEPVLSTFNNGNTSFTGAQSFSVTTSSNDILACIP